MSYITYEVNNRVATLTLNRPEKRNAFNRRLVDELRQAFTQATEDPAAKVIVLRAAGDVFSAGADLAYLQELQTFSFEDNLADSRNLRDLYLAISECPKVVVAQVQGAALAGGCGLATVCDIVFAAAGAKFGYTEVRIGFIPALVSAFLVRKIGEHRARYLLLTGELLSADQAEAWGLVHCTVPGEKLEATVATFVQQLVAQNSADAMKQTKELLGRMQNLTLRESLEAAAEANARARGTEDCRTGIQRFLQKEELRW